MISVANGDFESGRGTDEGRQEARVSSQDGAEKSEGETARVSASEFDSGVPKSVGNDRVLDVGGRSDGDFDDGVRVSEVSDLDREMGEESEDFEEENEQNDSFDNFDAENDQLKRGVPAKIDAKLEVYNSLLSEFDDFVANEKNEAMVGTSRALSYGFDVGDMVWGKVKSHPWWPGHIFNEALASSSVRRTRREGHVLVAFFGDSSYGWFDPAELIPFDLHYVEKLQQTNSRNFVKAVEEAVDELSRRCGLGLVCKCRNRYNFRPSSVQGYFAVDIPDYEAGGVYSVNQIEKARDGFRPVEILSFVKQLASGPQEYDQNTIEYIKNKATVFAFRKAMFEEFDETYAQAFGVQAARNSKDLAKASDQPPKEPTKAPLSGPLVIAEALGGGRSSKKPMKVKDHSKKDKYLFKRRDEPIESGALQVGLRQPNSLGPGAYMESSSTTATGDYVLQKRTPSPHVTVKHEKTGLINVERGGFGKDLSGKEALILDQAPGNIGARANHFPILDAKLSFDKEKGSLQETKDKLGTIGVVGATSAVPSNLTGENVVNATSSFHREGESTVDLQNQESAKMARPYEGSKQTELVSSGRAEEDSGFDKSLDGRSGSLPPPLDGKHSVGGGADGMVKKTKALKRPLGDLSTENSIMGEKKKKKKKELGAETSADRLKKRLAIGKGGAVVGNSTGKSSQVSFLSREDTQVNLQKKEMGTTKSLFNDIGTHPVVGMGNIEPDLPQLLNNLHALALDPFYGTERNGLPTTMHFFLRFRSLVYQKSLVLSQQSETEPVEARATKSLSSVGGSGNPAGEIVRDSTSSKPAKSLVRSDEPSKVGRKRLPSDRQEEIAAKKLKKFNQLKSLAAEKKMGQRTLETQRAEGKEPVVTAPPKPVMKPDSVKKMDPPPRAVKPTMLVMKFPPQTSLPSVAELKARFARFGSIDQSAIRVFWKSSTCRVVFRHKVDAMAAYRYAVGNSSLFGNVKVRYSVREVEAPEGPESDKGVVGRGDDTPIEAPRIKETVFERPAAAMAHQSLQQSAVHLKSILKKPFGDEAGQLTGGNGGRATSRVKFMLNGEEETSREEQLMIGNRNNFNNNNNNASFADGGASSSSSSSSVTMDINSKNFQKLFPPSPSPILPLPPQISKPPLNNSHYHTEVAPRNLHKLNSSGTVPPPAPAIDISQQMLSLLTRCNEVVTGVTSMLGYVPYHPL